MSQIQPFDPTYAYTRQLAAKERAIDDRIVDMKDIATQKLSKQMGSIVDRLIGIATDESKDPMASISAAKVLTSISGIDKHKRRVDVSVSGNIGVEHAAANVKQMLGIRAETEKVKELVGEVVNEVASEDDDEDTDE